MENYIQVAFRGDGHIVLECTNMGKTVYVDLSADKAAELAHLIKQAAAISKIK